MPHAARRTMGLFPGGEGALGRGSGGAASFPQSVPRHPTSACGDQGRVAERTRVARGWQGLASLIQLAGSLPPRCDSGPAGLSLGQLLFVRNPYIWIRTLPLRHPPLPQLLAPAAPSSPTIPALGLPRKFGKLCGCLWAQYGRQNVCLKGGMCFFSEAQEASVPVGLQLLCVPVWGRVEEASRAAAGTAHRSVRCCVQGL